MFGNVSRVLAFLMLFLSDTAVGLEYSLIEVYQGLESVPTVEPPDVCAIGGALSPYVGTVSLKIERPFVVTNEIMRAICVVSNGLHNAISLFEVGADGFGYDIERWESHKCKWQGTGLSWCASGRRVKKLERGVVYDFEIRCKPAKEKQRVALEYWVGDPLMSAPRTVFSESFNTMPQTSF